MKKLKMFNEIFGEVMSELNINRWWKLFDSDNFEIVESRIAKALKVEDPYTDKTFYKWVHEMAEDL